VQLSQACGDQPAALCAAAVAGKTAGSAGPDSATPAAAPARSRLEPRVHEAEVGAVRPASKGRALSGWEPRERFMMRRELST